jgi:hypothetical protein
MRKGTDMPSITEDLKELRRQLEKGSIQKAYRALLAFMTGLRTHLAGQYGARAVSGLYQGYLDMTYFAVVPPALKRRGLKVAIVFNFDAFRFEAWLAARNRKVQRQYWEVFRDCAWAGCRVVAPAAGVDAIVACDLGAGLALDQPDELTSRIQKVTAGFVARIEKYLAEEEVADGRPSVRGS